MLYLRRYTFYAIRYWELVFLYELHYLWLIIYWTFFLD